VAQFVALDVRSDRVQAGRALDMPVFFGDAGSPAVLHSVRAEKAACVVVALDTPGANYRTVWAVSNNFPNVKIYVRAHDVDHGINLEKAGAYAVVPEILEPSLQLAAAVLGELKMPPDEVASTLDAFRRVHLSELRALSEENGSSLGYGYQSKEKKEEKKEEKDKGGDKESSSKAMPGAPAPA
jgi:voltage-gated potassium channel Kch